MSKIASTGFSPSAKLSLGPRAAVDEGLDGVHLGWRKPPGAEFDSTLGSALAKYGGR